MKRESERTGKSSDGTAVRTVRSREGKGFLLLRTAEQIRHADDDVDDSESGARLSCKSRNGAARY